jgi:hypothetical protein
MTRVSDVQYLYLHSLAIGHVGGMPLKEVLIQVLIEASPLGAIGRVVGLNAVVAVHSRIGSGVSYAVVGTEVAVKPRWPAGAKRP